MSDWVQHCRLPPFKHQIEDVETMLPLAFCLNANEMGMGKTKEQIDLDQILYHRGEINRMIVICPAPVRSVWHDPELGELAKHLWFNTPVLVTEYRHKLNQWRLGPESKTPLKIIVTNYDFIRSSQERLDTLKKLCGPKTHLILDESSSIKSHKSHQTKACLSLRKRCGRVTLLNGTPISHSPKDMFSQGNMMSKSILECPSWFQFRARYAVLGGFMKKQIVEWKNLEDLQKRFAPFILRRLKIDCLDLPEKMPAVTISVPLKPKTWGIYTQMRDEMVAWLSETTVVVAAQAISKVMRLAQVTSGYLGGVQDAFVESDPVDDEDRPDWLPLETHSEPSASVAPVQVVGDEKLVMFLHWLAERYAEEDAFKVLVWCRFRAELDRLMKEIHRRFPSVLCGEIRGGQTKEDRQMALRLLDPRTSPDAHIVVAGTPATGSMGLNLTAAHTVVYMSNDYSLKTRLQSEDRVHRTGQTHAVSYYDIVATGPEGERTVDHTIIKSLRSKENLATWTASAWITALKD
jgi:SNF2 family DNA or RNA helicase